jgi:hypothetical protein
MTIVEILLAIIAGLLTVLVGALFYFFQESRRYLRYRSRAEDRNFLRRDPYRYWQYEGRLVGIIDNAERRSDAPLSWAAREMLTVPIVEQIQEGRPVDWHEVETSINKLIEAMREDRSRGSRGLGGERNAVSVIRAFFKRFCNIPPFCSPNDETSA